MNGESEQDEIRETRVLKAEVRKLRLALDKERRFTAELLSSTSWRVTAPLRRLVAWVRREAPPVNAEAMGDQRIGLPPVPVSLRREMDMGTVRGNETLRLLDASDAMAPLLDMGEGGESAGADGVRRARIATLVGTELHYELTFDADVQPIGETDWHDLLLPGRFDYLLLETVWHTNDHQWRYGMVAESDRNADLRYLLAHCREIGLPSVLWFREDPANYPRFAWLAELVDHVYAVDEDVLARLRADLPSRIVRLLPLAVQPRLHNPIRSPALEESTAAFAETVLVDGWWDLDSDPKRSKELREAFPGLRVVESEWDFSGVRLMDSPEMLPHSLGCVGPWEKAALAKLVPYEVFLQGSVRLPWRSRQAMLRASAGGCLPLQLGEAPPWPESAGGGDLAALRRAVADLNTHPLRRRSAAHRAARRMVREHRLAQRLDTIAADLGLPALREPPIPRVAAILVTMRPHLLASCLERFRNDRYPNKELIIVLHGLDDDSAVHALVKPGEPVKIIPMGRDRSLGACLNFAIMSTDAPYWSKFDDDDLYGPDYLSDIMDARYWCDFAIAGKPPMFAYLEHGDALYWDPVWGAYANIRQTGEDEPRVLIAGGTITGRREVVEKVPFSEQRRGGSDSDFIRRSLREGFDALSLEGFGFARFRSGRAGFHTWRMDNAELRSRATRVGAAVDVPNIVHV